MNVLGFLTVPDWLLVILVLLAAYVIYMRWHYGTFQALGVPLAEGAVFIFGHYAVYGKEGMINTDRRWVKKYGSLFGTFEGRLPLLVTTDTDIAKQVLVKDFSNFTNRRDTLGVQGQLEEALVALRGERWKQVRNILTPAFSSGKLKQMMPLILSSSEKLIHNTKLKLKDSDIMDCKRVFGGYTMDVIASTAFGIEVDSQSNPDDPVVKHASRLFDFDTFRISGLIFAFFPFAARFFSKLGFHIYDHHSTEFFSKFVKEIIAERRASSQETRDLLGLMLEKIQESKDDNTSADKVLSTEEIIAQCLVFFVAGYETTATTLALLVHLLALYPDKQEQLYEEIKKKLGSERPTYENIQELELVEMYLNETLRMYPPGPRLEREAKNGTEIKGIKIPKGMMLQVSVYGIHYNPEFWEDPEKFIPERFSPEKKATMNPFHFLPFGYGPRHCIGMRLAYLEAKVAVADFVRNFKVSICEKTKNPPELTKIGLIAAKNVWLKIEERH